MRRRKKSNYKKRMKMNPQRVQRIRRQLFNKGVKSCFYCDLEFEDPNQATLEHLKRLCEYPELRLDRSNMTLACSKCNSSREDRSPEVHRAFVQRKKGLTFTQMSVRI